VLRGKGIGRTADTAADGTFRLAALPAGVFELTIATPLFYSIRIQAVRLQKGKVRVLPAVELAFEGFDCNSRIPAYLLPLDSDDQVVALSALVVDKNLRPLAQARVTLFAPGGGIVSSRRTDRNGHFSITGIPSRRDYRIEVTRDGYFTEEFADFKVQPGYKAVYDRLILSRAYAVDACHH
jgi:hypothetical protein